MGNSNNKAEFKPYISADKVLPEFTVVSIILGAALAVLFGAANAYLGLKVGMTVSASIPAAVLSMGIIRILLKRDSILENNMVQTIGSAGESLAAGAIFTLPAIFMWAKEGLVEVPSYMTIATVAIAGGFLGIVFMIPLRKALIVKEHGTLPYPEGTACGEVLMAGEEGGAKASTVFIGLGVAGFYKFLVDGLKLFPSEVDYTVNKIPGAGIGMDVFPALAGVGYICGAKIASYMLAGGTTAWFVIMPLMKLFGGDMVMYPSKDPISQMGAWDLWNNYIRYVGAGAVAAGGLISLIKSTPLIIRTFKDSIASMKAGTKGIAIDRTQQDMGIVGVAILLVISIAIIIFSPHIPLNLLGVVIILVFGFFFATVSSRMVGLVGSSNNPVSGMTIATLLIATILLKNTMGSTAPAMIAAIFIGTIICIIAAMAGDMSQDLKTGYIVGATPKKQQIGEIIGVVASGLAIAGVLYVLNSGLGYGTKELPAPQASLMKLIIEGIMGENLPWGLVFAGVFLAVVVEILQIPVLPFAIGTYLPIHLSTPLMAGALLKLYCEKKKFASEERRDSAITSGILYSSGMIAGEGLVGIILAVLAAIPAGANSNVLAKLTIDGMAEMTGNIGGLVAFAAVLVSILMASVWNNKIKD